MRLTILALTLGCACGASTSGMSGPSISGKLQDTSTEAPSIQSNDILARDALTKKAVVKHILIGWKELEKNYDPPIDPRVTQTSRAEADTLAADLLRRVRAGEDIDALMVQYSEDSGSAKSARPYDVTADAKLIFEFKRLSLRLNVGEAGLVETTYGWHIIKRLE